MSNVFPCSMNFSMVRRNLNWPEIFFCIMQSKYESECSYSSLRKVYDISFWKVKLFSIFFSSERLKSEIQYLLTIIIHFSFSVQVINWHLEGLAKTDNPYFCPCSQWFCDTHNGPKFYKVMIALVPNLRVTLE